MPQATVITTPGAVPTSGENVDVVFDKAYVSNACCILSKLFMKRKSSLSQMLGAMTVDFGCLIYVQLGGRKDGKPVFYLISLCWFSSNVWMACIVYSLN